MTQRAQISQNTNAETVVRTYFGAYRARSRAAIEYHFWRLGVVALSVLVVCNIGLAQAQSQRKTSPLATELGKEFASETATVNGTTLHYVRGGNGPPIILIHGFPQDWFEYHAIMPRLANRFTVIAVDLRGIGGSKATAGGYDAANMADDVHQLVSALQIRARLHRRPRLGRDGDLCVRAPLSAVHSGRYDPRCANSWHRGVGRDSRRPQRLARPVYAGSGPSRETCLRPACRLPRLLLQLWQIHAGRCGSLCKGLRHPWTASRSV